MAKRKAQTHSIKSILNRTFPKLPFEGDWANLIGQPSPNFDSIIHGKPKAGKSTWCLLFAKMLSQFGKVLYVSAEEKISLSLQQRIIQCGITEKHNIRFHPATDVDDVEEKVASKAHYKYIIIDSAHSLGLSLKTFMNWQADYPHKSFHVILQSKRNGEFKGDQQWVHETDCKIMLEAGTAYCIGRFKELGQMHVFGKKASSQMTLFS